MTWNLGSAGEVALTLIDGVGAGVSGLLPGMVERAINRVNKDCGLSIGSTEIPVQYHNAILFLTCADLARAQAIQGSDANEVQLGDLRIKKGQGSNIDEARDKYLAAAKEEINSIGRRSFNYQTFYG